MSGKLRSVRSSTRLGSQISKEYLSVQEASPCRGSHLRSSKLMHKFKIQDEHRNRESQKCVQHNGPKPKQRGQKAIVLHTSGIFVVQVVVSLAYAM